MGKYFIYHMKKTVIRFVVMALFICVSANLGVVAQRTEYKTSLYYYSVSLGAFAAFAICIPAVIAALEFSQFMNRRNLDTWYSLPISRKELFAVHFLNGALQMTVSLFLGIVVAFVRLSMYPVLAAGKVWVFFAVIWTLAMFLYMVMTFLFICANNVLDGCAFMLGSVLFPTCLLSIFLRFFAAYEYGTTYIPYPGTGVKFPFDGYGLFSMMSTAASRYSSLINTLPQSALHGGTPPHPVEFSIPQVILWIALSIAALIGSILVFSRKKTENISGVSESWFGYRTLIPVVTACLLCSSAATAASYNRENMGLIALLGLVPTFVGVFVSYVIYRRGVKFKLPDILSMAGLVVFYPICLLIFSAII